jgi:hypothetical protein
MALETNDGEIFGSWKVEGMQLVRTLTQPRLPQILEANSERRKNPDSMRKLDWAKMVMSIPENDWYLLRRQNPDLAAPDAEIQTRAWLAFYNSSESLPYRLHDRNLARG